MSVPTRGECYSRLMEYLRKAQEETATLAHLERTETGPKAVALANGWLAISEQMKRMIRVVTAMAQGRLQ